MQVNFSAEIKDLSNLPIKAEDRPLTLSSVCCNALMLTFNDEHSLPGDQKVRRFKLATMVVDGGQVDLTAEDVAEIKKVVGKAYGPLIVGRAYELLDNS